MVCYAILVCLDYNPIGVLFVGKTEKVNPTNKQTHGIQGIQRNLLQNKELNSDDFMNSMNSRNINRSRSPVFLK